MSYTQRSWAGSPLTANQLTNVLPALLAGVLAFPEFVVGNVWCLSRWRLFYVSSLRWMPVQLFVVLLAIVPTAFGVPWLAVRKRRRIVAALGRLE
jgi:hypothetical protein